MVRILFSFHDLPELETIAKAAIVNTSDRKGVEFFGESSIHNW